MVLDVLNARKYSYTILFIWVNVDIPAILDTSIFITGQPQRLAQLVGFAFMRSYPLSRTGNTDCQSTSRSLTWRFSPRKELLFLSIFRTTHLKKVYSSQSVGRAKFRFPPRNGLFKSETIDLFVLAYRITSSNNNFGSFLYFGSSHFRVWLRGLGSVFKPKYQNFTKSAKQSL